MEVMDRLKARSFFGFIPIRRGLFVIAFIQLLTGIAVYMCYKYLRPSLHSVACSQLTIFSVSAVIGVIGAYRRNTTVEGFYFATFLASIAFLIIAILDFTDVVHMMPKAPEGATEAFLQIDRETQNRPSSLPARRWHYSHGSFAANTSRLTQGGWASKQDIQKTLETLPFVPHIGETEGESEEISIGELPPEAKGLPTNAQNMVITITKMQKRPVKLAFAGVFGTLLLFHLYFGWIILTFLMNKCMSLDELTGQPEQFQPLIRDE
ncbi:hypothetical protein TGARI_208330 [Toxoplasma gondii ARI]|uniref:Transmembrane protein n=2 Tax=Toxoplasma gondii TaxID=5811 RepID=A0A139XRG6_TOXGO|nr:putative transmembrane protein [Toxoplasma gondii FOU]KYF41364.1 hypothetical protein TGARI_208330 [Toxoplasma gondii ARI]